MKEVPQITAAEAAALVKDGDILLGGGFGMTGNPVHLLHALACNRWTGLPVIPNPPPNKISPSFTRAAASAAVICGTSFISFYRIYL